MHPFRAPLPEGHRLQYNLARLVMNRHLYGPSHGFPLVMIEGSSRKRCPTSDVRYQQCWRARIIQDELFLCTIFTYYHPENTTDRLMRFMRVSHQQICPHLRIRASNPSTVASWPRNLPELNQDLAIPNRFITPVRSCVSSCAICRTDYQVKIQQRPSWKMWGPRGWIISIVTWQQLGKCRSPFDWDWRIMALDVMNDLNSRWRSHADMPGVIRHRWSQGDDTPLEPEGDFFLRVLHFDRWRQKRCKGDSDDMASFRPLNILILGATGQIGKYITNAVITAKPGFNQVTVFTSKGTRAEKVEYLDKLQKKGVKVVTGDLTNEEDVQAAFKGIDTVVSALGRDVIGLQAELIRIAEESPSVKWFFPSEYGTDIEYGPWSANEKPHQQKLKVRKYIRENVKRLKYTFLVTGPYIDMYFDLDDLRQAAGGFDPTRKKAILVEDGEGKVGFTTMPEYVYPLSSLFPCPGNRRLTGFPPPPPPPPSVGKALVAALRHPEASFGKALKVQSFVVTPKEILAEFEKQTGTKWDVTYSSLQTLRDSEAKAWNEGAPHATILTLRRIWSEGGTLYEKTDNERIGIKDSDLETLEAAVKRALTTGWSLGHHYAFELSLTPSRFRTINLLNATPSASILYAPTMRQPPSVAASLAEATTHCHGCNDANVSFSLVQAELNAPQDVITCKKKTLHAAEPPRSGWWHSTRPEPEYSSGLLPHCIPMNDAAFATVSSIFTVGGLVGALCAGPYASKHGRLSAMRLTALFYIVGATLETTAGNIPWLAIGRFLSGIAAGASTVVVPLYISEISPPSERGLFGATTQISINVGILFTQALGYFLSYGSAWRGILGTGIIIAFVQAVGLVFVPESPAWLAANRDVTKARLVLQRIRGNNYDIREETAAWEDESLQSEREGLLSQAEAEDGSATPGAHLGFIQVVKDPQYRPAIIAVVAVAFAQQFCGINSVIMYSVSLLTDLLPISSALLTILISVVNLVTTVSCSPLPDRLGRKTCILLSIIGQGTSSLVLALSIRFGVKILSAVSVVAFVGFFAVGLGPVPFILASELVGQEAVGATQSLCLAANYIATFFVAQFFPIVNATLNDLLGGAGWVYFIFAGLALFFAFFISWRVPETKGKKDADEVWGRTRRLD
ncbi:hypothetical protein ACRALDRAFT_2026138 [Sodiomyces alcalophilus JCM 7366]|uniref:uncharacterized protein n=1 Tax=Sodiomyces alcalophilus JCM 7366 TaxID=591952 RepID=UPI0039B677DE